LSKGGEEEKNPRVKKRLVTVSSYFGDGESESQSESGEREVRCWAKIQSSQAEESRE
jgi:hypothetical protein